MPSELLALLILSLIVAPIMVVLIMDGKHKSFIICWPLAATLLIWLLWASPHKDSLPVDYLPIHETPDYYIFNDPVTDELHNVNRMFGVSRVDPTALIKVIRMNIWSGGIYWTAPPKYELQ